MLQHKISAGTHKEGKQTLKKIYPSGWRFVLLSLVGVYMHPCSRQLLQYPVSAFVRVDIISRFHKSDGSERKWDIAALPGQPRQQLRAETCASLSKRVEFNRLPHLIDPSLTRTCEVLEDNTAVQPRHLPRCRHGRCQSLSQNRNQIRIVNR